MKNNKDTICDILLTVNQLRSNLTTNEEKILYGKLENILTDILMLDAEANKENKIKHIMNKDDLHQEIKKAISDILKKYNTDIKTYFIHTHIYHTTKDNKIINDCTVIDTYDNFPSSCVTDDESWNAKLREQFKY